MGTAVEYGTKLFSDRMAETLEDEIFNLVEGGNIFNSDSKAWLRTNLNTLMAMDFGKFMKGIDRRLGLYGLANSAIEGRYASKEVLVSADILSKLEILYGMRNSVVFLADEKSHRFTSDRLDRVWLCSLFDDFEKRYGKDVIINVGGSGKFRQFSVLFLKQMFTVCRDGREEKNGAYTMTVYLMVGRRLAHFSLLVVPKLYPRMFLSCSENNMPDRFLNGLGVSRLLFIGTVNVCGGETDSKSVHDYFVLPFGRRCDGTFTGTKEYTGYTVEQLFNLTVFCMDKYVNKKSVCRSPMAGDAKHSGTVPSGSGESLRVQVGTEGDGSHFVRLKDVVTTYENKKKAGLGGHHRSPREHERRGHYRGLKGGRTVWVRGSTVNKGKGKVVYTV